MIRFERELSVPADFSVGLQTERPELLRRIDRPLTREEGHAVADALATVLETLIRERDRADRAEGRLGDVGQELVRIKRALQKTALDLHAAVKRMVLPEPPPGDEDEFVARAAGGQ